MIKITGKYNSAKVFTNNLEETAREQIKNLCDMPYVEALKIRIMPDVHAGAGCTIGTTMTIRDTLVPNLVGVDIGCGMETIRLKEKKINLEKLDNLIYAKIPSGRSIRKNPHPYVENIEIDKLKVLKDINYNRAILSVGTLGGGNHFIEISKDEEENLYLVVHSGSRHIGNELARLYQNKGKHEGIPKDLAYLEGKLFEDYLHDMKIIQQFAVENRRAMVDEIIRGLGLIAEEEYTTIHNYIDLDNMILRKGAVSAKKGEKLLIPINMRDGSLICVGKGNPDWNYSAPHGAGRIMSRTEARRVFNLDQFKREMKDVYSTSINRDTLDEIPMAYKDMDEIIENTGDTIDIIKRIKPIYNFKAKE